MADRLAEHLCFLTPMQTYKGNEIRLPFLYDEWLARQVEQEGCHFLQIWRGGQAIVLGSRDAQLPQIDEACSYFRSQEIAILVRQSGGALVPLDEGVLNVSLIVAHTPGQMSIDDDFRLLVSILTRAIERILGAEIRLDVGEVQGAYCPGRFDLSIDGKKVAGLSQRKTRGATIIHAFLNVTDDGGARARTAQIFYNRADHSHSRGFSVQLEKMSSLQAASHIQLSMIDLVQAIIAECVMRYSVEMRNFPGNVGPQAFAPFASAVRLL